MSRRRGRWLSIARSPLRRRLLANGAVRDADHVPVLKLFDPCGAATWLIAEMRPDDPDTLLCDLGHGFPEFGDASLAEIAAVRGRLGIERDLHFAGRHPLSVYAAAAASAGFIVETGPELEAAAGRNRETRR